MNSFSGFLFIWIPAFAGMTESNICRHLDSRLRGNDGKQYLPSSGFPPSRE